MYIQQLTKQMPLDNIVSRFLQQGINKVVPFINMLFYKGDSDRVAMETYLI